ncbi:MAG: NFACT family protein [Abditibacteriota bacterium]|nr:NFACT family protein [Abditibacteriota bacterium]
MIYDGFTLSATIAELKRTLTGGRVQKIKQLSDTEITFAVHSMGKTYLLFFSVDPRHPRVYTTASSGTAPQTPPNFCMVARKYLEGAFAEKIEQVGLERIMIVTCVNPALGAIKLIFELMGRHSNLIITDNADKILGAIKNVGSSVSRRRILTGLTYELPPVGIKTSPADVTPEQAAEIASAEDPKKALVASVGGVSPFLAEELMLRSGGDGAKLYDEISDLGKMITSGKYMPVFITDEAGKGTAVYPMPLLKYPPERQHPRESLNESLDTLYRTFVRDTELTETRQSVVSAVEKSIAFRKSSEKSLLKTIGESERADEYRIKAELLQTSGFNARKGDKTVKIVNYYDPSGAEITIDLDPKLDVKENAERYFKRYRKAKDARSTAEIRLTATRNELTLLADALEKAKSSDSAEDLRELQSMLTRQNLLRTEKQQTGEEKPDFDGHRVRRFYTDEGWEVLYGENASANDYLTTKLARPNDLWFHARQITGSHVIVRAKGKNTPIPHSVILRAAKTAAANCDAKHSSMVPIDYTYRKFVRKPRGAAVGFVTYRNEKTIDIVPGK